MSRFKRICMIGVFFVSICDLGRAQMSSVNGMWQDASYTDQLSGKHVSEISIDPTSDTDNDLIDGGINIRCKDNELDLLVTFDQVLTPDTSAQTYEIDYRIGNNDVKTENWDLSTNSKGLFYHGDTLNFIHQLETSNAFVAQSTPVGQNHITDTYDLTGLQNAVAPVLKACGF